MNFLHYNCYSLRRGPGTPAQQAKDSITSNTFINTVCGLCPAHLRPFLGNLYSCPWARPPVVMLVSNRLAPHWPQVTGPGEDT